MKYFLSIRDVIISAPFEAIEIIQVLVVEKSYFTLLHLNFAFSYCKLSK